MMLIGFVGIGGVYALGRVMCGRYTPGPVTSPDGRYVAILNVLNCGATTSFGTRVDIIEASLYGRYEVAWALGVPLGGLGGQTVLSCLSGRRDRSLLWRDAVTLEVDLSDCRRSEPRDEAGGAVRVVYQGAPAEAPPDQFLPGNPPELVARVPAPSGNVDALLYEIDDSTGATASFGYEVYVVRKDRGVDWGHPVAILADVWRNPEAAGVHLAWEGGGDADALVISYLQARKADVLVETARIGDRTVRVRPRSGVDPHSRDSNQHLST